MINPKYDPNNYLKHLAIPVITDNQKINQLFGSYLLRVKWWHTDTKQLPPSTLVGRLRIHTNTPFGALEPQDYELKISNHKQIFVQFLTLPNPEFQYRIEVIHPVGITRSMLEIWEYQAPQSYLSHPLMSSQSNPSVTDPALLAALNAVAASSANTTAAVLASDENKLNYADTQLDMTLGVASYVALNNANRIHLADPNARELIISNNNGSGNLKIVIVPPADGTIYSAISSIVGNPIEKGGSMTISDPMCRGSLYAIGSQPNMKVNVSKTALLIVPII